VNAIQTELNTDRLRLLEQKLEETQKELTQTKSLLKSQQKNAQHHRRQNQQEYLLDKIPLQRGYVPHENLLDSSQHYYSNHLDLPQHIIQTPYYTPNQYPQQRPIPHPPCTFCGGMDHYSPNNLKCAANPINQGYGAPHIQPQRGTMFQPRGGYRGRGSGRPARGRGQTPNQYPKNQSAPNQEKIQCYKCGGDGHMAQQCANPEPPPNQNKNLYE